MMTFAAYAAAAFFALKAWAFLHSIQRKRVGGITFYKAGRYTFTLSRSPSPFVARSRKRRAVAAFNMDERQGYGFRAYVSAPPAPRFRAVDERQGYGFRAYR